MTICNTIEYKLCSELDQNWAFNEECRIPPVTGNEAARRMGVITENITIMVKNNHGGFSDVEVHVGSYMIRPAHFYKTSSIPNGSKFSTVYMIKGTKPNQKTCVYFTQEAFDECAEIVNLKSAISSAAAKYRKDRAENLHAALKLRVPASAQKAQAELPAIAIASGEQGVFAWFDANGFDMTGVKPSLFTTFTRIVSNSGKLVSEVEIEKHESSRGTLTKVRHIDFTEKRFLVKTFYSGD